MRVQQYKRSHMLTSCMLSAFAVLCATVMLWPPCHVSCVLAPPSPQNTQVSAKIDEAKAASEAIRSDIAVLNTRLDRIKAAREAEQAKLSEIQQAASDARADIPALNVEKKELWEVGCWVCGGAQEGGVGGVGWWGLLSQSAWQPT